MNDLSLARLYVLRGTYLLMAAGLAAMIWPLILFPGPEVAHMNGVVRSLLGAVGLLAILGLRYPVRMIPLLLFELAWKAIWLLAFGLPLWKSGTFTPATRETWETNLFSVPFFIVVIPWAHVWREYLRAPGEAWRARRNAAPVGAPAS